MLKIYKITSDPVVDYAAEELKKYLRMMMPRCGEIIIERDENATDGFRLGLMQDFGLDVSEADDPKLDDILHIDTDENGGIIAGSNPRSVLLAVYRYLTINGCRWLFPGIDGEFIPIKDIEPTKFHKMADCRFRGQCNEGAESQQCMIETIDFSPKIGLNAYMIEFEIPKVYYARYYNHDYNNANREPEPVTAETILQWKRACEAEIAKRGLQFHDMGHGWTAEPFGLSSVNGWAADKNAKIPEESREFLSMVNGVRDLWKGVALNTNFCMSNPKARKKVVDYVCDYAAMQTNVDFLHVWLADDHNNHCECEECVKRIVPDWYVIMLNELDEELTRRGLDTHIVFCCYLETAYPPETVTIKNPRRFTMLLGAITRNYVDPVSMKIGEYKLREFTRNNVYLPECVDEYIAYAREWKKRTGVPTLVYEYHFHMHQYYDPAVFTFAKLVYDDVRGFKSNGLDGIIEDGSQRSYYPNGFAYYLYAQTLFDTSVDIEAIKEDYFSHAYGEDFREVISFFEELGKAIPQRYVEREMPVDLSKGRLYNPEMAAVLRGAQKVLDDFAPFVEAHKNMPMRAQTVSYRILRRYLEYVGYFAKALILKSLGADTEAKETFKRDFDKIGAYEIEMELSYDHRECGRALFSKIFGSLYTNQIIPE